MCLWKMYENFGKILLEIWRVFKLQANMTLSDAYTYLSVIIVMFLLLHMKNYLKAVYLAFKLPGPPALPLLGNVMVILDNKKLEALGTHVSQLYGSIARVWVSIVPFFFIVEPNDLQIVLGTNKYTTKSIFYKYLHNFLGEGLITTSGTKWRHHRRLIQPHFNHNVLKVFFDSFHESSTIAVQSLRDGDDCNVTTFANRFAFQVLHGSILGIPIQENSPFRKGKVFVPYRVTRPWLLLDSIFNMTKASKSESEQKKILQDYTKEILRNRMQEMSETRLVAPGSNLMDMLIDIAHNNPQDFDEKSIIDEIATFMLAGQDSVGAALTFTLYFLAKHQDVQEKVVEELTTIFEDTDRVIAFEDTLKMKYLEQCIKEAMRLCPSVPLITRKLTEEVTLSKIRFPAGTNLLISPFATHRLPHFFPDPLRFNPDRFSAENVQKIHPFAYIPFSAGPRNCIGSKFALIEMKTVLSETLRLYHLSLVPGREELNLAYRITLRAKGGVWLRFKHR